MKQRRQKAMNQQKQQKHTETTEPIQRRNSGTATPPKEMKRQKTKAQKMVTKKSSGKIREPRH